MEKEIILTWSELFDRYDGGEIFEFWFCGEMYEKVEDYGDPEDLDAVYEKLTERYGNSKFRVTHHNYIKWRGKLNSDFRVAEVTE